MYFNMSSLIIITVAMSSKRIRILIIKLGERKIINNAFPDTTLIRDLTSIT